jgi:heptosyltransferase III
LKEFERILVIKTKQLGDVLLSTPLFAALREAYPHSEIVPCVNTGGDQMLVGNPDVNDVLIPPDTDRMGLLARWRAELRFARNLRKRRFDLAIDLTTTDRSALLARISGAPIRLGYRSVKGFIGRRKCYTKEVQPVRGEHIVRKHLRILEAIGIHAKERPLVLRVSDHERQAVEELLHHHRFGLGSGKQIFQVHPISRIAEKNWPASFMAETVNAIAARYGWVPVITGSADPQEKAGIAALQKLLRCEHLDLSGKVPLKQLGALSQRAKFLLGVDTAPMHIAAAVGTPVVALFGPSSEKLWAPWCDRALVLSRELDCRLPCKNKQCQTIHCLREFTPAMVLPRLEAFLSTI